MQNWKELETKRREGETNERKKKEKERFSPLLYMSVENG